MIARDDEIKSPSSSQSDTIVGEDCMNGSSDAQIALQKLQDGSGTIDTPVLIVGAGPSGLLQAYLLSRLGIKCMIIERYAKRLAAPKAHALSPRSLEICRQFGLDTHKIRQLGTPRSEAYWVNFITNVSGQKVGRLPYERMDVDVLNDTPEMIHNIPQPAFENFVQEQLPDDLCIIRNASFLSCHQDNDHVYTSVQDRVTGTSFTVRSKHVIACDGARSRIRANLHIESDGEDSYETMMTIHFSADLRPVLGDRVGMLHWVMDPAVSGFIIGYDLSGNQVLICNFDSKKQPVETWSEASCRQVLRHATGQDIPFEVLSFRPWVLSRKVARDYRRARVFLAGDAAHSFPPTGGLGLNSGLADVHNLAYKIAAVHNGWGGEKLLDTYGSDRRHVAEVNSQQSVKNGKKIFSLLKAMGTTHPDIEEARRNLALSLQDPKQRAHIDREIQEQQEHFDNLELHIGYVYGSKKFPPHASHYEPKFVPGARLPHVWIRPSNDMIKTLPPPVDLSYIPEMTASDRSQREYSVLDLCAHDAFTFFVGKGDMSLSAALKDICLCHVPVRTVVLHRDFSVHGDRGEGWLRKTGLGDGGALLVRPDQHILAFMAPGSSAHEVARVVRDHLGLGPEA